MPDKSPDLAPLHAAIVARWVAVGVQRDLLGASDADLFAMAEIAVDIIDQERA